MMPSYVLRQRPVQLAAALVALAATSRAALASPADVVFMPYGDEGARYVQYALGAERRRDGGSEQAHALALGLSPTARWYSAAYVGWYREPGEAFGVDAVSWVNHVNLTPATGPLQAGLYVNIERPRNRSEGFGITWGPTFQFDTTHAQLNLNLWLQKNVRAADAAPAALTYQWQAKSLWQPGLELGAQGFGTVGPWRQWSALGEQEHQAGPAVFAKWPGAGGRVLNLDAGLLAGLTTGSPRATFRVRTQYQF